MKSKDSLYSCFPRSDTHTPNYLPSPSPAIECAISTPSPLPVVVVVVVELNRWPKVSYTSAFGAGALLGTMVRSKSAGTWKCLWSE